MIVDPHFFRQPSDVFTADVLASAAEHAAACYPQESCGLVRGGTYRACENIAEDPSNGFEMPAKTVAAACRAGDLQGVIHSHPDGPWWPSRADMQSQVESAVPWAVMVSAPGGAELACHWGGTRPAVFVQGLHVPRAFLHGVSDCYTLCQDYYRETGVVDLPEFPRDWEWWKRPETENGLYLDNLAGQGFRVVSTCPDEFAAIARPGDAYLMTIRSKVPNHAGIYLGEGLLLEHMQENLSHREPIARKLKHITHWLRFEG